MHKTKWSDKYENQGEMYQGSAEAQDCPSQEVPSGEIKRRRGRGKRQTRRKRRSNLDAWIHSFGY